MSELRFKQVDVFTARPYFGNPVAVILDADELDTATMQRIAAWTNLSETTFLLPPTSPAADYLVRIFTPRQELPFAGHPTLGSAHAALESGLVQARNGQVKQQCEIGNLDVVVESIDDIRLLFVRAPKVRTREVHAPLFEKATAIRVEVGPIWVVVDLGSADAVDRLLPDMSAIARMSDALDATGVTVFGRTGAPDAALHVRTFAPGHGAPEDPVCGSGNIAVAAFLRETRGLTEIGSSYTVRQGMQVGRDGRVQLRVTADDIWMGGPCVTCVNGTIRI